ncbi:MAG: hypothetical protein ACHQF2_04955 [Flavobacteriales bacterium]
MNKCQCTQCGSADFKREGEEFLRCSYCNSLFKMLPPEMKNEAGIVFKATKVVIAKGANVVFGENSNVKIHGELIIEHGANVQFLGEMEIIEKAGDDKIEEAKLKLKKINEG